MLRVLLAVPADSRWDFKNAFTNAGANPEALEDLSKGLRATTARFDLAVLDGAIKSLTLKWAVTELQKRNAAVKIFVLGGEPVASTSRLDPAMTPQAIAVQLLGAPPKKQRDFEETGSRVQLDPLFSVNALRKGTPQWIIGNADDEVADTFVALSSSLAGVKPSSALPTLLEFGRDEECAWVGFAPLPPGAPLTEHHRLLRQERSLLSVETAAHVGLRCCEALSVLHAAHVRHGHVRPFAVWCPDEGPVMLRFGAVGELIESDRLRVRRSTFGTARRMDDLSPEQFIAHQPGDLRTDLYQLGHLLYELLSGASPFAMWPHDRPIIPPIQHVPEVPAALSDVVAALLSNDPAGRPALSEVHRVLRGLRASPDLALSELRAVRARLRALLGE